MSTKPDQAHLGIEGRRGPPRVSAFQYRAMQAVQPTRMMMPALGREHELLAEAYVDGDGRHSARPIRQLVVRTPDGRMNPVPFPRAWNAEQLRAAVQNRGLHDASLEEVYFEADEDPRDQDTPYMRDVRLVLSAVFGQFHAQTYGGVGERTQNEMTLVAAINQSYLRALAKVAFHYFLWACPLLRGDEQVFEPLRTFISEGQGDWREFVQLNAQQFLPPLREGYVPARTSHFFYASLTREAAVVFVQFFVGPHGLGPPSRVRLAANPLTADDKRFACHQACYFDNDADRHDGHDGELVVIEVWERRIITP